MILVPGKAKLVPLKKGAGVQGQSAINATPTAHNLDLTGVVEALRIHRALPALPADPFQLVLWDNIGALIPDERRAALFAEFGRKIGYEPGAILAADPALLLSIAERGGMRPLVRVERWQESAAIVLERGGGDLRATLGALPIAKARALLKRFPVIGDPGADKILLFAGIDARPSLDPNGLRSLVRLGFFPQQPSYAASYKAGIALLSTAGKPDREWLMQAYLRLRAHGKILCRRGTPLCDACPFDPVCAHAHADQF
jgi:endonuclease-3